MISRTDPVIFTAMQYSLLSTARRFSDYETVGGLFKDATMSSVELTLTERIWDMILEIVRENLRVLQYRG